MVSLVLVLVDGHVSFTLLCVCALLAGVSEGMLFAFWPGAVRDSFGSTTFSWNLSLANTALGIGTTIYLKAFGTNPRHALWASVPLCLVACALAVTLFVFPAQHPYEESMCSDDVTDSD